LTAKATPIDVDIVFAFAGWEMRSTEVAALPIRGAFGALIRWDEAGSVPRHGEIVRVLRNFLGSSCEQILLDEAFSMWSSLDDTYARLQHAVLEVYVRLGRPLHLAFDLSNCPEYFPIRLLAIASKLAVVAKWYFFYAEAVYPEDRGNIAFTWGEWNVTPVPGLQRPLEPPGSATLVLGLGFEGQKARQIVAKYQPNRLILILPDPGFTKEYTLHAVRENAELLKRTREAIAAGSADKIVQVAAGDALGVATTGDVWRDESASNVLIVPTGPKAHAIGLALAAIPEPTATLLYRNPERYEVRDSINTGSSWALTLSDNTILPYVALHNDVSTVAS
jgi:hypothetical protein